MCCNRVQECNINILAVKVKNLSLGWDCFYIWEKQSHPLPYMVIADFTDMTSPFTLNQNHSRPVADLAEKVVRQMRFPDADTTPLRRAGLIHDIGRVGVCASDCACIEMYSKLFLG